MIYHVLRLKWKPDTPEETKRQLFEQLKGFESIEAVEAAFVGWNVRNPSSYDVGAIVELLDEDAFQRYLYDPVHLALDRAAIPHVREAQVFDLCEESIPGLGERLDALGTQREQDETLAFSELGDFPIGR
jgi:hypothetical protein